MPISVKPVKEPIHAERHDGSGKTECGAVQPKGLRIFAYPTKRRCKTCIRIIEGRGRPG